MGVERLCPHLAGAFCCLRRARGPVWTAPNATVASQYFRCWRRCCGGLAPSASFSPSARALQGVGAAIELSAALAVLGHESAAQKRPRAFGFWEALLGVAVAVGPLVCGVITLSVSAGAGRFSSMFPVGAALMWAASEACGNLAIPCTSWTRRRLFFGWRLSFGLILALIGSNRNRPGRLKRRLRSYSVRCLFALFVAAELIQNAADGGISRSFRKRTFLVASSQCSACLRRSGHDDLSPLYFCRTRLG